MNIIKIRQGLVQALPSRADSRQDDRMAYGDNEERKRISAGIGGAGAGLLTFVIDKLAPGGLPRPLLYLGAVVSVCMIGWALVPVVKALFEHARRRQRVIPLIGMTLCLVGLVGFGAWYVWPPKKTVVTSSSAPASAAGRPVVLTQPQEPKLDDPTKREASTLRRRTRPRIEVGVDTTKSGHNFATAAPRTLAQRAVAPTVEIKNGNATVQKISVFAENQAPGMLRLRIQSAELLFDNVLVGTCRDDDKWNHLSAQFGFELNCNFPKPLIIPDDTKEITFRVTVLYDDEPPRAERRSYRAYKYIVRDLKAGAFDIRISDSREL